MGGFRRRLLRCHLLPTDIIYRNQQMPLAILHCDRLLRIRELPETILTRFEILCKFSMIALSQKRYIGCRNSVVREIFHSSCRISVKLSGHAIGRRVQIIQVRAETPRSLYAISRTLDDTRPFVLDCTGPGPGFQSFNNLKFPPFCFTLLGLVSSFLPPARPVSATPSSCIYLKDGDDWTRMDHAIRIISLVNFCFFGTQKSI